MGEMESMSVGGMVAINGEACTRRQQEKFPLQKEN